MLTMTDTAQARFDLFSGEQRIKEPSDTEQFGAKQPPK